MTATRRRSTITTSIASAPRRHSGGNFATIDFPGVELGRQAPFSEDLLNELSRASCLWTLSTRLLIL
jgi:hypothetical protein